MAEARDINKEYAELSDLKRIISHIKTPEFKEFWELYLVKIKQKEDFIFASAESKEANHSFIAGQLSVIALIKDLPDRMLETVNGELLKVCETINTERAKKEKYAET